MTENTKPDWLIAREDERRAKDEPMTDGALLGRLEPELDATLDALVPLIQRDQDARAARDTLRDRELGISTLEGMIAEDRDAERRLMVSEPREAVNARVRANEATAMRARRSISSSRRRQRLSGMTLTPRRLRSACSSRSAKT